MKQTITVIIPAYNEESTIHSCLLSLQDQTLRSMEIIVVDDGSTDKTAEIVKGLDVLFLQQSHRGPGAARNLAAGQAKGDVLVFVDADMTFAPDFIDKLTTPIREGRTNGTYNVDEFVSNYKNVYAQCWNLNQNLASNRRMNPANSHDVADFRAITKKEFQKVGGFSLTGYTDSKTLSQKLGYLPTPVAGAISYHQNPSSLTEVFFQARWIGRRPTRLGSLGKLINLVRYSLPVSLLIGMVKEVFYQRAGFLFFKVVYDFGFFTGVISSFTGKTAK